MIRLVASPDVPAPMLTQLRVLRPGGVPPVQLTVNVAVVSIDAPGKTSTLPKLTLVMLTVQVDVVPADAVGGALATARPAATTRIRSAPVFIGTPPAR
jgi:hypothetical protein